jgi:hypothetical protein
MAFDFLSTPNMLVISLDILLWLTLWLDQQRPQL